MKMELLKILLRLNEAFNGEFILYDVEKYVEKIINNATIITFYNKGTIEGFIAFYNNDLISQKAFLTMLAIDPLFQGKGLGEMLLKISINRLRSDGFKSYYLEVLKQNEKAIKLYLRNGFQVHEETQNYYKMKLDLK